MWKRFTIGLIYFALSLIACPSWAAHPLIFDVDFVVKCGLTKSETDLSVLAGITFRF
jgi:hypothetical protein